MVLSLLIIGILLMKKLFKNHISVKYQYYIWFLFLFMLIIPFISVNSYDLSTIYSWIADFNDNNNGAASSLTINKNHYNIIYNSSWLQDFSVSVSRVTPKYINNFLLSVWFIGIITMSILTFYCSSKIRKIKKNSHVIDDSEIIILFEHCKKNIGIKRNILLHRSSLIETPITFGVFKPCVILPDNTTSGFSQNDIRYIFLHELQHYKHKDILINYAMCIFQILYWFHPLVWYALKEMRTDREIACDISVLNMLDEDNYVEYGNTIINFADKILLSSSFTPISDMGGHNKQIKKRILKIASFHAESRWMKIKSNIIFIVIGVIVLGSTPILSVRANTDQNYNFTNYKTTYEDLSSYFYGFTGSFVLYDSDADQYYIYNRDKSIERTSPDSTYKIYSALYGLETGTISKENSTLNWNGIDYPYDSWNKNQDLFSAMKNSVTWYFQNLDSEIGFSNLKSYFKKIDYGNYDLSGGSSDYWMQSSLKISPIEQVDLLKAFYSNQFGFQKENIQTVKDTLLLSESNGTLLSGKTGTGNVNGKNINGWFIGYVENSGKTYFFATNIQNDDFCNGITAAKITLSILNDKNIYSSK